MHINLPRVRLNKRIYQHRAIWAHRGKRYFAQNLLSHRQVTTNSFLEYNLLKNGSQKNNDRNGFKEERMQIYEPKDVRRKVIKKCHSVLGRHYEIGRRGKRRAYLALPPSASVRSRASPSLEAGPHGSSAEALAPILTEIVVAGIATKVLAAAPPAAIAHHAPAHSTFHAISATAHSTAESTAHAASTCTHCTTESTAASASSSARTAHGAHFGVLGNGLLDVDADVVDLVNDALGHHLVDGIVIIKLDKSETTRILVF